MEYKVFEKQDIQLMKYFVDDENTRYNETLLEVFLKENKAFGYVAKEKDTIVGFAYGYVLVKPDGRRDFICMQLISWKAIKNMVTELN